MICERLAKDRDMERRLEQVESHLRLQSTLSFQDNASIRSGATTDSDDLTIRPTMPAVNGPASTDSIDSSGSLPIRDFEALLNSSWVYQRNEHRDETMSFHSSVLRLSAWSVLSDMSLANISIIAVMSLPVQLQELSNGHWYARNSNTFDPADRTAEKSGGLPSALVQIDTDLSPPQRSPPDDGNSFVQNVHSPESQASIPDEKSSSVADVPATSSSAGETSQKEPAVKNNVVTRSPLGMNTIRDERPTVWISHHPNLEKSPTVRNQKARWHYPTLLKSFEGGLSLVSTLR